MMSATHAPSAVGLPAVRAGHGVRRRSKRAGRGRNENVILALAALPFLALVLACGLFYSGLLPAFSGLMPGFLRATEAPTEVPFVRFVETRTGHLLFIPIHGDFCRRIVFD